MMPHVPKAGGAAEFDPESERHFPLLIIKAVEPGCTTELQIEDCDTGQVTRVSTTDDAENDDIAFMGAIRVAWEKAWERYQSRRGDDV
jgi:hypothetical protein